MGLKRDPFILFVFFWTHLYLTKEEGGKFERTRKNEDDEKGLD